MVIQFFRATLVYLILTSFGNLSYAAKLEPEYLVNTFTAGLQSESSVAGLAGGGFVVTWDSYIQDIYACLSGFSSEDLWR